MEEGCGGREGILMVQEVKRMDKTSYQCEEESTGGGEAQEVKNGAQELEKEQQSRE